MSSPFIIIDEITEKINEMNTSLTTKIDTISSNTTTIINNTKVNNTASGTGSLSQKLSWIGNTLIGATGQTGGSATAGTVMAKLNAAITNTAATTTENSSGILSAKLTYLINRRNRVITPSSTNIKTLNSSSTTISITTSGNTEGKSVNSSTWSATIKQPGIYRLYATASLTVNTKKQSAAADYVDFYYTIVRSNGTSVTNSLTICSSTGTNVSATTKTVDLLLSVGEKVSCYVRLLAPAGNIPCVGTIYNNLVSSTIGDVSIRGTVNELNGVVS